MTKVPRDATASTEDIGRILALTRWRTYAQDLHSDEAVSRDVLRLAKDANVGGATRTLRAALVGRKRPAVVAANMIERACALLANDWRAELVSEGEVCAFLGALQTALESVFAVSRPARRCGQGVVLVAPAPTELHAIAATAMSEILREAGVSVRREVFETPGALLGWVADNWVAAVALHLSPIVRREDVVAGLPQLVERLRVRSRNPGVRVGLQGASLFKVLRLSPEMGADATSRSTTALAPFLLRWVQGAASV